MFFLCLWPHKKLKKKRFNCGVLGVTWGPSFGVVSISAVPSGNKQSEAVLKSIGREMLASKHSQPVNVLYALKDNVVRVEKRFNLTD